jgi:hypothetical protein
MMATVFMVIEQFCIENHKCIVTPEKRNIIGQRVSGYWNGTFQGQSPLPRITQLEPEGKQYEVVLYPEWFKPKMYEIVEKFYAEMRANRKKIPHSHTIYYKAS